MTDEIKPDEILQCARNMLLLAEGDPARAYAVAMTAAGAVGSLCGRDVLQRQLDFADVQGEVEEFGKTLLETAQADKNGN